MFKSFTIHAAWCNVPLMILQNMQAAIVELGVVLSVVLTVVGCDVMGI